MRNRAMCSGDESALFYVYRVLQKFNAFAGAESIIQAQLKKEYGQPFQHMLNALESRTLPTPPEVSAGRGYCHMFPEAIGPLRARASGLRAGYQRQKNCAGWSAGERFLFEYAAACDLLFVGGWTKEGLDGHRPMAGRRIVVHGHCFAPSIRPAEEASPQEPRTHRP